MSCGQFCFCCCCREILFFFAYVLCSREYSIIVMTRVHMRPKHSPQIEIPMPSFSNLHWGLLMEKVGGAHSALTFLLLSLIRVSSPSAAGTAVVDLREARRARPCSATAAWGRPIVIIKYIKFNPVYRRLLLAPHNSQLETLRSA